MSRLVNKIDEQQRGLDFKNRRAWRSWLEEHHDTASEAWLVIQKKGSKRAGLSLAEAVEEALCYGWIDSTLRTQDDHSYLLRFSPRRPDSIWSVRNIRRVEKLIRLGRMTDAGLKLVQRGKESGQWQAALDRERTEVIPPELEAALRQKRGALEAYRNISTSKKKQYIYWLQSAKGEQTKRKRIARIVREVLGD